MFPPPLRGRPALSEAEGARVEAKIKQEFSPVVKG